MNSNHKLESDVYCSSLPIQSNFISSHTKNADTIKEFRNMFLEKYLENNKIGRKSKCNFKSKAKSISSINYLNTSMQRKIINKSNDILSNYQSQDSFCNKFHTKNNSENNFINDNDNDFNLLSVSYDSTFFSTIDVFDNNLNYKNRDNNKIVRDQQTSFYKNKTGKIAFQHDYLEGDIFQIDEMNYMIKPENYTESSFSDGDFLNNNLNDFHNSKNKIGLTLLQIPASAETDSKNEDSNGSKYLNTAHQCSINPVNEWLSLELNFD
jgi:hypothetical protein